MGAHIPFQFQASRFAMTLAALAVGLAFVVNGSAFAAEAVGEVVKKQADAYGTPPDSKRQRLYPRSDIYYDELLETSGGAALLIVLDDKTELFLGERAQLTIDEFVYDPGANSGKALYNFTVGTLRFVSGKMPEAEVVIQTPNAHIGLRGSDAIIFVTPAGDTTLNVLEGSFSLSSRAEPDQPAVTLAPNQNVTLSGAANFSDIGTGIRVPDTSAAGTDKVANFGRDLETFGPGADMGGRSDDFGGASSDSGSSGGH